MDIFTLKALVDDLQPRLAGAVVSKVFQMSADDLLLRLWRQHDRRLLLSTHPKFARLHLTAMRFENPQRPPRFAAYLRAHLQHARLLSITVQPYDRIVSFTWERRDASPLTLVHEMLGSQSNILLVDAAGLILEALKRTAPDAAHPRPASPGQPYQPPPQPQQRRFLPALTLDDLVQQQQQGQFDAAHVQRLIIGLSPLLTAELIYRSQGDPHTCWEFLQQLRHDYDHGTLALSLGTLPDGVQHLSPLPLTHVTANLKPCSSAQDGVAAVYEPIMQSTLLDSTRRQVQKRLRQQQHKLRKKIGNLQGDERKLQQYLDGQRYGTLLMGQHVPRGATSATVVDYYSPHQATLSIALDPRLSVQENAEAYFKKYRKAKSGMDKVRTLLVECAAEEDYLDTLSQHIDQADDWTTLQTLETELHGQSASARSQPPRSKARPPARPKSLPAAPYRTFTAQDGSTLYCGKSSQGNEMLLRQIAQPDDVWFHAHRHAGAHVLLKVQPHRDLPHQTLVEAAAVAAYYSKGKDATAVEVIYTQAKHVRKFRGARPGQVSVKTYQTLEVAPRLPEAS